MKSIIVSVILILTLVFFYISEKKNNDLDSNNASPTKLRDNKVDNIAGGTAGSGVLEDKIQSKNRINVSNLPDLEEKKQKNQEELKKVISKLKFQGPFKDMIKELNEMTDLEVEYLSTSSPGVSYDENFPSKDVSDQNMNFDMENIPFGEILKYFTMASGLKYKVDLENGIVTLADMGVILEEQHTENYSNLFEYFDSLETEGDLKPEEQIKEYLNNLGISFGAGSRINLEQEELSITNSEAEHKKLKKILETIKAD